MNYFDFAFGSMWFIYIWETYLDFRQHQKLCEKDRPAKIVDIVDQEKFDKAQSYGRDKSSFAFVKGVVSMIEGSLILWYGGIPWVWKYSVSVLGGWGYSTEYEITASLLFIVLYSLYSTVTSLPFSLYSTFFIEEKHGFNKQTLSLFFADMLKSTALSALIGLPLLALFLYIIKIGGEHFYIYVWVFMFGVQMLMVTIYPLFIQPCFNKVEPLPNGELKSAIEVLAEQVHYPLKKLYQIDGSKRSGHSNAYMYGFCKNKRIVLFDTLIQQQTKDEVVAVLGHELGHWALMHTIKMLVVGQVHIFFIFYLFGTVINDSSLYSSFGVSTMPTLIGFLLFNYILSPIENVINFFNILLTRKHEFEADKFAVNLGYGGPLRSGLIKLQLENLGNMNPDSWYSTFHYSHPPLVERLDAIEAADQEYKNKTK